MFSLSDQIALITGARRGIGQAIALQLAKQGAFIVGTATTLEGASEISKQLKSNNLEGQGVMLDISDQSSIFSLIKTLKTLKKMPSILINNAGITQNKLALRIEAKEWQKVIDTNLNGIFYLTQQCLPFMIQASYGRIINISSFVGTAGNIGQTSYAAAKAGLIGFSKTLALEVATRGITVNNIAPGFIQTDMTNTLTPEKRASWLKRVPMQRLGTPQDIGNTCVFLASKESGYITGATLHVNGGL